jgi:BirA family biotin operon repressor/biotin-[acetyl-CoA-carboxylase] ligase
VTAIPGWPAGVGLIRHDVIDSTNEEARRLAAAGESGPLWIAATEQTAGRGRRGRIWVSQAGNLFATLLIAAPTPIAAQLGFAAGLAAAELVSSYAPRGAVALKWPNDVLLDGRKVAGILLEGVAPEMLAIGIGINLAHHPQGTEFPATSLAVALGHAPDPDDALVRLAGRMVAWYEIWRNRGFAEVRSVWLARAALEG